MPGSEKEANSLQVGLYNCLLEKLLRDLIKY